MEATLPKLESALLEQLRRDSAAFLARCEASGQLLTTYTCEHCHEALQTPQPTEDLVGAKGYWDGLKTCVHCGHISFVRVWPDGRTEVVTV